MNCVFLEPINLGTEENPDWEYSVLECGPVSLEAQELITNQEYPERSFFIEKTYSFGDLFLIFLLILVLVFAMGGRIFNYFWSK